MDPLSEFRQEIRDSREHLSAEMARYWSLIEVRLQQIETRLAALESSVWH